MDPDNTNLGSGADRFRVYGDNRPDTELPPVSAVRRVTPDYFRTIGVPLIAGPHFSRSDNEDARRRHHGQPLARAARLEERRPHRQAHYFRRRTLRGDRGRSRRRPRIRAHARRARSRSTGRSRSSLSSARCWCAPRAIRGALISARAPRRARRQSRIGDHQSSNAGRGPVALHRVAAHYHAPFRTVRGARADHRGRGNRQHAGALGAAANARDRHPHRARSRPRRYPGRPWSGREWCWSQSAWPAGSPAHWR